jgi:S-adenosylmethionine-diacylglycerol 3-amino-3-carboxypropyl transferase
MMTQNKHQVELHKLIYTVNWEDPESDHKALKIQPGDTLMTITSGACNTLGFLVYDPKIIHTVDINPSQAYLMELKIAAMKHLEYTEFVRFLGLTPTENRLKVYGHLRNFLSPKAAEFWDGHQTIVQRGFLFQGRYDYFVKIVGKLIHLILGRSRIVRLFEERELEEQKAYYDRYWNILRTRLVFYMFYNKHMLARMGLKADYFHFDDGSTSFAGSFHKRFQKVACDIPIQGNYFLHVYLMGKYRSLTEVPDYLREDNFEVIRKRLDRIHIITYDAKRWLAEQEPGSVDCFALSNICELMSLSDTSVTFEQVARTARKGARMCFRNLMIPRTVPDHLQHIIKRDSNLSTQLLMQDRSFVYSRVDALYLSK